MAVEKELKWVRSGQENGHVWERAYHDNRLVAIRCANCGEPPINVMREDFTAEMCRGTRTAPPSGAAYNDLVEQVQRKIDKGGVLRFRRYTDALRHMADTPDSLVLVVAVSPESARFTFDNIVTSATDMWGDVARVDRARQRLDWSRSTLRMITPDNAHVLVDITPTGVVL